MVLPLLPRKGLVFHKFQVFVELVVVQSSRGGEEADDFHLPLADVPDHMDRTLLEQHRRAGADCFDLAVHPGLPGAAHDIDQLFALRM